MPTIPSGLFSLSKNDLVNGALNAIFAAVVVGLYGLVTTTGFDLFAADWHTIGKSVLNWAFAGFVGSIGKSFLKDENGTVHLGVAKIQTGTGDGK